VPWVSILHQEPQTAQAAQPALTPLRSDKVCARAVRKAPFQNLSAFPTALHALFAFQELSKPHRGPLLAFLVTLENIQVMALQYAAHAQPENQAASTIKSALTAAKVFTLVRLDQVYARLALLAILALRHSLIAQYPQKTIS